MRIAIFLAAALSWAWAIIAAGIAGAAVIPVSDTPGIEAALRVAEPGDVIELAGGVYDRLLIRDFEGGTEAAPITLRSADPGDPGRLRYLDLRNAANLRFEGLVFDYTFRPGHPRHLRPFQIVLSRDITFAGNLFDGDRAYDVSPADDGFPTGFGLAVQGSRNVTITGNEIRAFFRGLVVGGGGNILVQGNDLHDIRMDGMNFSQVVDVEIAENHIHDFARSMQSDDHADMIQFWTNGTTRPTENVLIRDNILNAGHGWFTQSIFIRNDLVDRGLAGEEMFYRNLTIRGNVIINAHLHGITVGETLGLTIENNAVLRNYLAEGRTDNPNLWTPRINLNGPSRNVRVTGNVTYGINGGSSRPDWIMTDNLFVQDRGRLAEGLYYDRVFVNATAGDPADLASFAPLPGGPLDGTGIGPAILTGQ